MSSVVVPAFVTKASKSSRNAPRKPKIWRLKSFVQGCVALFFPGYSSIISFPNLVDQGERYHNISEKFLALVNALTRHGPGPEDNMSVNLARKAASSIPVAHRPCCTSSRVCRSTSFIRSSLNVSPLQAQAVADSNFAFMRRCDSCIPSLFSS